MGLEPDGPGRMSLTRKVPASVPSLCHSSNPALDEATKKILSPSATAPPGEESDVKILGLTSLIKAVPPAVPSVLHGSPRCSASLATKKTTPLTAAKPDGDELDAPGRMSARSAVPSSVPSALHSS